MNAPYGTLSPENQELLDATPGGTSMVDAWKIAVLRWQWRAYAPITRPLHRGGMIIMPGFGPTLVGEGYALTRWGAERKGRRRIRYAP